MFRNWLIFFASQLCLCTLSLSQELPYINLAPFDDYFGVGDTVIQKNQIKEVHIYQCYVRVGSKDSCLLTSVTEYDKFGRMIKRKEGGDLLNKNLFHLSSYTYLGNNGMRVTKKYFPPGLVNGNYNYLFNLDRYGARAKPKFKPEPDGNIEFTVEYTFLQNGDILKRITDSKSKIIDSSLLTRPQLVTQRAPDDSVIIDPHSKVLIYKYDDSVNGKATVRSTVSKSGKLIEKVIIDERPDSDKSEPSLKRIYIYDEQDRLLREFTLGSNNTYSSEKRYTYNSNGVLINYYADAPGMKNEISCNDRGDITEIVSFETFSKTKRVDRYSYDPISNLLQKKQVFINSALVSYVKYDYKRF